MTEALPWPCETHEFVFDNAPLSLLIPSPGAVAARFSGGTGTAPYWARIWPASIGLCEFLTLNRDLVAGKRVLELAAGLGLPGLLAARYAAHVTLSDLDPDAVRIMEASAAANGLLNVSCRAIDWSAIPPELQPELVLLSDVNYEPAVFDGLYAALEGLRRRGVPVVLSSPQRLMAKPFIERLESWITDRHELKVGNDYVSVFEL